MLPFLPLICTLSSFHTHFKEKDAITHYDICLCQSKTFVPFLVAFEDFQENFKKSKYLQKYFKKCPSLIISQVEWSPSVMHQDLVYLLQNGTLIFYPFTSEQYKPEIHSATYRYVSKSIRGSLIRRINI